MPYCSDAAVLLNFRLTRRRGVYSIAPRVSNACSNGVWRNVLRDARVTVFLPTAITRRGGRSSTRGYRPRGPLLTLVGYTVLAILHQRQLASDLLDRHPLFAIEI